MEIQKQVVFQNIEAAYTGDLTFWELMILGKLLPLIQLSDTTFCDYFLQLNSFFTTQNIDNESISNEISIAIARLLERRISWTYLDKNEQTHQCQTTLLASVDFFMTDPIPSLNVSIHPKFKTLLLSLTPHTQPFGWLEMPFLKISTSHRLYLILLQNITQNLNSFSINLEKLKDLLGFSGKYALYANFKIKILEEAQKRLLHDASIHFDFSEIKTGKKITAIRFRINKHLLPPRTAKVPLAHPVPPPSNANVPLAHPVPQPSNANVPLAHPVPPPSTTNVPLAHPLTNPINAVHNKDLIEKISKKFGVTQRMLKKLTEDFSEQSLNQAMLLTEKALEKGSIKGSPAGFFVEAVRQNYQVTEEDEQAKRQAEARQKAEKLAQIEAEQREQRDALKRQEFEQERDAILEELAQNETMQQTISERIRYSIFHASYDISKTFDDNLENPSFVAAVLNFYKIIKKY